MTKYEGKAMANNILPLFAIKTDKLEPLQKDSYFKSYIKKDTKLTIQELKRPEFKKFIFSELKHSKKRSF